MFMIKQIHDFRIISSIVRWYSIAKGTHYDVLNLRKNCSDKDIKEAYIHMSKEYHPDKNKDANAQQNFVRVVEAYNVLSKPSSRASYDRMLDFTMAPPPQYNYRTYETYGFRYNPQSNAQYTYTYHSKKKHKPEEPINNSSTYYGFTGIRRVPNYVIILLCFGIAFLGTMLQVFIIRELYVVHRRQAMERSRYLSQELDKVRAAAASGSNEEHTRLLLDKIVIASNPTVATASLGQALANEKNEPPKLYNQVLDYAEFGEAEPSDEEPYVSSKDTTVDMMFKIFSTLVQYISIYDD